MPQWQSPLGIHRNPLRQQQLSLDPVTALAAEAHRDASLGIHNPVPWNLGRQLESS